MWVRCLTQGARCRSQCQTALQGLAGVSLTCVRLLGPRKASQHSLGIFSPASCYVIQKTCGFPLGTHRLWSVYLVGTLQPSRAHPALSPGLMTWLILFAEPHMGSATLHFSSSGHSWLKSPNHTCSNYGSKGDSNACGVSLKPPTGTLFNLGESLKGKGHLLRLANESAKAQRG